MKTGRPHEFDQVVSVRLTKELHDALSVEALRREMRLSDVIRERLVRPSWDTHQPYPSTPA
jgi:predicted HicB family RNase H-like nuclease